jgi:hypothetical protein
LDTLLFLIAEFSNGGSARPVGMKINQEALADDWRNPIARDFF